MEIRDQLSGEPSLPEWLSTHPSHRNRITHLDRLIPQVQIDAIKQERSLRSFLVNMFLIKWKASSSVRRESSSPAAIGENQCSFRRCWVEP